MPITSYSELQAAVMDWLEDRTDLASFVPDFIRLGEGYIANELRVRQMETRAVLTPSGGEASLPLDYIEMIAATETTNPRRVLQLITRRGADQFYPSGSAGLASFYDITGSTLSTYPVTANGIEIVYFAAIPPLSDVAPTNWLLQARPELYLRTGLMHAAEFIKNDPEAAKQKDLADLIIMQMNRTSMLSRGRGGITLRGPTP